MPEIRNQSIGRDDYSVHFGPNVYVYDVSRTLAEAIVASYYQNLTALPRLLNIQPLLRMISRLSCAPMQLFYAEGIKLA